VRIPPKTAVYPWLVRRTSALVGRLNLFPRRSREHAHRAAPSHQEQNSATGRPRYVSRCVTLATLGRSLVWLSRTAMLSGWDGHAAADLAVGETLARRSLDRQQQAEPRRAALGSNPHHAEEIPGGLPGRGRDVATYSGPG
jgi:hypothetical protein